MKRELFKQLVLGAIVVFFTSAYTAFLNTIMKQGFLTENFLINWMKLTPKIYVLLLPFALPVSLIVKKFVEKIFSEKKQQDVDHEN